jgi:release factor glutamine methyltransferase
VLDLGTGPGTLLLAALDQWPRAAGLGVDRSMTALEFARRNARRLGLADRARFRRGDWDRGLDQSFDLVLCNPPYVAQDAVLEPDVARWEPPEALYAGADGLEAYRRLAPALTGLLAKHGLACIEIGIGQEAQVRALFETEGLTVSSRLDLAGLPRCLVAALNK